MNFKKLDNNEQRDALIGLVSFNQEITFFDFGSVAVQKKYLTDENVRIISGGRYFNGDFVGEGMLTCFIHGEHFLGPSSKLILRTLRELCFNHTKGVLILVPGSSENLFNFGLAYERAKNDNLRVRLIQVNDNSNKNSKCSENTGSTGVVLLIKIAGAMAERGKSLSDIYQTCNETVKDIFTVGLNAVLEESKDLCTLCKKHMCKISNEKEAVIHVTDTVCSNLIATIFILPDDNVDQQKGKLNLKYGDTLIIFISSDGSLKKYIKFKLIRELIQYFSISQIQIKRIYAGNFISSHHATITFMKVNDPNILKYLDAPSSAPGWNSIIQDSHDICIEQPLRGQLSRKERLSPPIRGPKLSERVANTLLFTTQFACYALISCEKQLNKIDMERGTGDFGSKFRLVSEVILKRMEKNKIISNCPFTFFETLSKTLETAIGGIFGSIYSILFESAASSFIEYPEDMEITPLMWLKAFNTAAEALKKYANASFGDGTMYDPISSCLNVARIELENGRDFMEAFGNGVEAAEYSAVLTKKHFKYPDSGAHAVVIWMRASFEGIKLTYPFK